MDKSQITQCSCPTTRVGNLARTLFMGRCPDLNSNAAFIAISRRKSAFLVLLRSGIEPHGKGFDQNQRLIAQSKVLYGVFALYFTPLNTIINANSLKRPCRSCIVWDGFWAYQKQSKTRALIKPNEFITRLALSNTPRSIISLGNPHKQAINWPMNCTVEEVPLMHMLIALRARIWATAIHMIRSPLSGLDLQNVCAFRKRRWWQQTLPIMT